MFCLQCNAMIPDGSPVCPNCGAPTGLMPPDMSAPMPDMGMGGFGMPQPTPMPTPMPTAPDMPAMPVTPAAPDMPAMPEPAAELPPEAYGMDFYSQSPGFYSQPEQSTGFYNVAEQSTGFYSQPPETAGVYPGYGTAASPQPAVRIIQTVSDEADKPMSFWQSIGFFLLISFPLVGFIATVIFACSHGCNHNLRNLSRALVTIKMLILLVILVFLLTSKMLTGSAFSCFGNFIQ